MNIRNYLSNRWHVPGGYREVLTIALPLVITTSAWSLQHFIDRVFLSWYGAEAIAASMPAGLLNFTFMSIFTGTASYVGTFIAQYIGARRDAETGKMLWQSLYIAIIGGCVHLGLLPLAPHFFRFAGHGGLVFEYEVVYFRYLCLGAFPAIAASALGGFYAGQGRTLPLMWVNFSATAVNIVFDYLLIFGKFGFPELGIQGAAIATVMSAVTALIIFSVLIFRQTNEKRFRVISAWHWQKADFGRLLRFGLPVGTQFFLDIAGFTVFLLLMGRLGTLPLAATNVTFNINNLAFMPMIGFGIAVSVLVGQALGRERPDLAEKATYSAFHLTMFYMGLMILAYLTVPDLFLLPFAAHADAATFSEIKKLSVVLLRLVALYSVFDTFNIIFSGAIKGAGDTRFVMYMLLVLSVLVLIIPAYVVIVILKGSVISAWMCATVYICLLGIAFFVRFLSGKWKTMRLIEPKPPLLPSTFPETPTPD